MMETDNKGSYYYMKLRNGTKKGTEVKAKVDKFVNEKLEQLHKAASEPIDLRSILVDKA